MSQGDILNALEDHKGIKFTSPELAILLKTTSNNLGPMLLKLRRFKMLNFDEVTYNRNNKMYRYWHKED